MQVYMYGNLEYQGKQGPTTIKENTKSGLFLTNVTAGMHGGENKSSPAAICAVRQYGLTYLSHKA